MRKTKRIRVYRCPYCDGVSTLHRRSPGDDVGFSICSWCAMGVLNHQVESWLEDGKV